MIQSLPSPPPNDLRKALENLKRAMPEQLELMSLLAEMDFAQFNAYVKAGFKPEQALDLLKAAKVKASL